MRAPPTIKRNMHTNTIPMIRPASDSASAIVGLVTGLVKSGFLVVSVVVEDFVSFLVEVLFFVSVVVVVVSVSFVVSMVEDLTSSFLSGVVFGS